MKELTVHTIGVVSLGKLIGTYAAIIGLLVGIVSSISGLVAVIANNDYSVLQNIFYSIAILAAGFILVPIVWFILGWIQGALIALVFNVVVTGSGGLSMTVEEGPLKK